MNKYVQRFLNEWIRHKKIIIALEEIRNRLKNA